MELSHHLSLLIGFFCRCMSSHLFKGGPRVNSDGFRVLVEQLSAEEMIVVRCVWQELS